MALVLLSILVEPARAASADRHGRAAPNAATLDTLGVLPAPAPGSAIDSKRISLPAGDGLGEAVAPDSIGADSLDADAARRPAGADTAGAPRATRDAARGDSTGTETHGVRADSATVGGAPVPPLPLGIVPSLPDAPREDGIRTRLEIGAGADGSNELLYEDAYVDTTFLGRHLVSSPEYRWSVLGLASVEGSRDGGLTRFHVQDDASVGDLLRQNTLRGLWQTSPGFGWTLTLTPSAEYRLDRTFGRDLTVWRAGTGARLRRRFDDDVTSAEAGLRGEILRTSGTGADFLPDRVAGRATLAIEHLPIEGLEWQGGYGLAVRSFPDSTVRDHFEHSVEGRLRLQSDRGDYVTLEGDGIRRVPRNPVPNSRDDFLEARGRLEGGVRLAGSWTLVAETEIEATRYAAEDSVLYFDYHVVRVRVGPRIDRVRWNLLVGPRAEWLYSPLAPAEEYREIAGVAELDWLSRGAWWSLQPAAGWRGYDGPTPADLPVLHTSYAFAEGTLFADQPLPRGLRLRATGTMRLEWHTQRIDDARSLYFSLELRKLL